MESNVYRFETTNDLYRREWCAKQETGRPIDFYVSINAVNQTEDKIIQAYVLHVNEGVWKLYDTHHKVRKENKLTLLVTYILKKSISTSTTIFLYYNIIYRESLWYSEQKR